MANAADLDLPLINLFDPAVLDVIDELNQEYLAAGLWLVATPIGYSVIEHDAVRELQKDPRLRTLGTRLLEIQGITDGDLYDFASRVILNIEGDEHTRLRRLVSKAFTPRAVDRLRPLMRRYITEQLDRVADAGRCDAVTDIAESYPIAVICELVGAPVQDWPKFSAWATSVFKQFSFEVNEHLAEIEEASFAMQAYVESLVEQRRSQPGDDLLTELLAVEEEGDRLTHTELVDLVASLILAGTDTTRNQLGLSLQLFAEHPDQWAQIVADRSLVPQAVEEALRFSPTAGATPRVTVEEITYRDITIPADTIVTLVSAAANRDPSQVSCPMDFDVDADRGTWQSLTFGSGPHYCLGANLARAELQEAIDVIASRWRTIALDGVPEMKPQFGLYGPASLPVRFEDVGS